MSDKFFWNNWRSPYRHLYIILLFLFTSSVLFSGLAVFEGESWPFSWEIIKTYKSLKFPLTTLEVLWFDVSVPVEQYLVSETFKGSNIALYPQAYMALACITAIFLSIFLSIITMLSRLWYFIGVGLVAVFLLALRLEQVILFDRTENLGLFVALLFYFPLSYYFYGIKPHISFAKRIGAFLLASIFLALVFGLFSDSPSTFVFIGSYGSLVPIGLTLFFIFLVSHDIISFFLNIITSKNTFHSKNSLSHFLLISSIYLAWVLLTYMHDHNYIDWDIIYLNATFLLMVSAVIGVWEFKYKNENAFPFLPFAVSGAFFYLVLAIVSFTTIGIFYITANDVMLEMLEDVIIFSHLGVGIMFFIYVFANFAGVLSKNLKVYKILYKPQNLPYFTATIGGIIVVGVLVSRSMLAPFYQGVSGYYTAIADAHGINDELFLAEQYYKLSRSYQFQAHRSNYSLASLARRQGDEALALKYFDDALQKNPSEYAYVNLANIYQEKDRFFDALFSLKEGLEAFPHSAPIRNNIGVLFSNTNVLDSALYYFENASVDKEVKSHALVNKWNVITNFGLDVDYDSIQKHIGETPYLPYVNNLLAGLNISHTDFEGDLKNLNVPRVDLNAEEFTFWYSYYLNQILEAPTQDVVKMVEEMVIDSTNEKFQPELAFALGLSQYYCDQVGDAFLTFTNLTNASNSQTGYYYYILGLWAFEQNAFTSAVAYFERAEKEGYLEVKFSMAVALTLSGEFNSALSYWNAVVDEGNQEQQKTAKAVQKLLVSPPQPLQQALSDSVLYLTIYFDTPKDALSLRHQVDAIEDEFLRSLAHFSLIEKAFRAKDYEALGEIIGQINEAYLSPRKNEKLLKLKLHYWAATGDFQQINDEIKKNITENIKQSQEYIYFQARQAFSQGDIEKAQEYFSKLATLNPFFEEGTIAASRFFHETMKNEEKAYKIILDALTINPNSIALNEAYIMQSLQMQLISYADNGLKVLETIAPPEAYREFSSLYQQRKDSIEQAQAQW